MRDFFAFEHFADAVECFAGHRGPAQTVVFECAVGGGHPVGDHFADRIGVDTDFVLGMAVGA